MNDEILRMIKSLLELVQDRFNSSANLDEKWRLSGIFGDLMFSATRIDNIPRYGETYRIDDWDRSDPF